MIYLAVIGLFTLVSCGTSDSGSGSSAASPTPVAETSRSVDPDDESSTFMAKDDSALPECVASRLGRLAYIVSSKTFKACDESGWQTVSIKGQDGKDGTPGTSADNTWRNPVNARVYLIGSQVLRAQATCPTGWTMPDFATVQADYGHGLGTAMTTLGITTHSLWLPDANGAPAYAVHSGGLTYTQTVPNGTAVRLVCYK